MATIHPFRALRPPVERVAEVASPPYDVVNTEEARELAKGNPLSFFHVSRPEIDLAEGTDLYSDQVYQKAAENFEKLIRECPLENEAAPSIYLYRLVMGEHQQIGVVACSTVDEYDADIIRKHEKTRPDKEDDRTRQYSVACGRCHSLRVSLSICAIALYSGWPSPGRQCEPCAGVAEEPEPSALGR